MLADLTLSNRKRCVRQVKALQKVRKVTVFDYLCVSVFLLDTLIKVDSEIKGSEMRKELGNYCSFSFPFRLPKTIFLTNEAFPKIRTNPWNSTLGDLLQGMCFWQEYS